MAKYIRALLCSYLAAIVYGSAATFVLFLTFAFTRYADERSLASVEEFWNIHNAILPIIILNACVSAVIVPLCSVAAMAIAAPPDQEKIMAICTVGGASVGAALGILLVLLSAPNPYPLVTYSVAALTFGFAGMKSARWFAAPYADSPNNSLQARRP